MPGYATEESTVTGISVVSISTSSSDQPSFFWEYSLVQLCLLPFLSPLMSQSPVYPFVVLWSHFSPLQPNICCFLPLLQLKYFQSFFILLVKCFVQNRNKSGLWLPSSQSCGIKDIKFNLFNTQIFTKGLIS